ncbi:MAG: ATP-binding cassette domain-containing protein [Alphaproteobacteria bacterium]|nr:MAG: ATP-binding cassette domain-containing protein [Alphaproteobacteria bacterium]
MTAKETETGQHQATHKLMRRIISGYVRPHISIIIAAALLMMLAAAMTGLLAKLMEPVIDDVFSRGDLKQLWQVAILIFSAFTLRGAATYGHTVLMGKAGQAMIADVQKELFSKLIRMDISFFQQKDSGHLIVRMVSDTTMMRMAMADSITGLAKGSFTLIVLVCVMFYQDWKLTLISLFIFPPISYGVMRLGKKLRKTATLMQEESGNLTAVLQQSFQGIRHIRAYGLEEHEDNRVKNNITRLYKFYLKVIRTSALATPMSETVAGLAIVTIIIYGGYQVMDGATTAGKLFSFIAAFLLAYEPMKRLANLNTILQTGLAAAQRVFDAMDVQPEITDRPGAKELKLSKAPEITFENVCFSYPDNNKTTEAETALDHLSFTVPAGKTVALVGPSGAGKSTVINLLLRLYDADEGRILVDGKDIRDVSLASLRGHAALVSQDVTVFNDTARDNIRCSRFDASDEDVESAAKAATAHDFILEMENGYDTVLGEKGATLSGGQRQRIAIARAVLRGAPLLLLDEATSALDNESERAVQSALKKLQKGRTTLVIAHRLSTVQNADLIYVIDRGQIVEHGTHKALLKKDGVYKRLYGGGENF